MSEEKKMYGYAGTILRINLTDRTTERIPSSKYLPELIGGRAVANRIFWDEMKGAAPALSAENKLIYMTGASTGTGLPACGRATLCGIAASTIPEQYSHSSIGGHFAPMLKYAGYDGFILEGRAEKPCYVFIKDDKVSFLDAEPLWGKLVQETEEEIFRIHGRNTQALVIGPAGENQCRFATVATGYDSAAAKGGFGAVFGYKNCKAIAVQGTGTLIPFSVEKVFEVRDNPSNEARRPNPMGPGIQYFFPEMDPGETKLARMANCTGCSAHCAQTFFNVKNPLEPGGRIAITQKCLDAISFGMMIDCWDGHALVHSHRQEKPGVWRWCAPTLTDPTDPDYEILAEVYPGDKLGLWEPNFDFGYAYSWCCNEYGLDKWDTLVWVFTWCAMAKKEGLLKDGELGVSAEIGEEEFAKQLLHNIAYREGVIGDHMAEGMARFIRWLGKEKYGDAVYHGRANAYTDEPLDLPISIEACWGQCSHHLGRGFQGAPKDIWLLNAIEWMIDSRDASPGEHACNWIDEYKQYKDDPYHSEVFYKVLLRSADRIEIKDAVETCDFRSTNPTWPDQEADLYYAATGREITMDDLFFFAKKSRLLYRAVLMRDYGRCRDFEVRAIFPYLTWPDPFGEIADWDDFNDLVDAFYKMNEWDLETGWPYRSTWEKYGLKDIADEMEARGMLPPEGENPDYRRKEWPFAKRNCPVGI